MKKSLYILIFQFFVLNLNAQFFEKNALYATSEIAIGNYFELNVNMNLVLNDKYSLQSGGSWHIRSARSKPDDYTSGLFKIFTLGLSDIILDEMDNYQVLFGRIYPNKHNNNIRFNLAGGIGFTVISEPTNWVYVGGSAIGQNYTYDMEKHKTISLIFNPKVEFPFSRFFGITISPMLQVNKDRMFIGIGAGSMIGMLKQKEN
jgi:hypothetical protein